MMKLSRVFLVIPFLMMACNNETTTTDTVESTDSSNQAKMDSSTRNDVVTVDAATSKFLNKVADGGMMEVQAGQLAQQKGMNQRIKDYGSMMVNDHSKANDELKSLAPRKSVSLPDSVSSDHKKKLDQLNAKSGKDFDRAFINMMVDDHQKDVNEFEKRSNEEKDADVKAWVDRTLPTLKMHLDSAKAIKSSIK